MAYNRDLDNVLEYLGEMSTDARLWIFQSERQLSPQEESAIEEHLGKFLSQWTSHNRALLARGAVAYGHFVIVALDESKSSAASGCSIDAMTHQIQGMSKALGCVGSSVWSRLSRCRYCSCDASHRARVRRSL